MANLIHYRPIGATGGLITGTCSDAAGPVDFTNWTDLKIVARHPGSKAEKFNQTITADPNQTTNPGVWSYQPVSTDVDTTGHFHFYIRGTDPNGDPWQFPIDDPEGDNAFGTLIVY